MLRLIFYHQLDAVTSCSRLQRASKLLSCGPMCQVDRGRSDIVDDCWLGYDFVVCWECHCAVGTRSPWGPVKVVLVRPAYPAPICRFDYTLAVHGLYRQEQILCKAANRQNGIRSDPKLRVVCQRGPGVFPSVLTIQ
jgi:hypothetical protein